MVANLNAVAPTCQAHSTHPLRCVAVPRPSLQPHGAWARTSAEVGRVATRDLSPGWPPGPPRLGRAAPRSVARVALGRHDRRHGGGATRDLELRARYAVDRLARRPPRAVGTVCVARACADGAPILCVYDRRPAGPVHGRAPRDRHTASLPSRIQNRHGLRKQLAL